VKKSALKKLDRELGSYLDSMVAGLGRSERRAALSAYMTGLLLDGERKSVEPMASRLVDDQSQIEGMRQRLLQAVSTADWPEAEMFARVAKKLDKELPDVEALVIDDTGFPKKGTHSVGVHRQYSGTLGRVENCQVAVSLHLAGTKGSGCIDMRLFLPESWASDEAKCSAVGVPKDVRFSTKLQIALDLLDRALRNGVRKHTVLADAGYGDSTDFREALVERGLQYVVGVAGQLVVWSPESNPRRSGPKSSSGKVVYRDDKHPPQSLRNLATTLKYRRVRWREGSRGYQSSRFAAVRVRTAHRHNNGVAPGDEVWLLSEWPEGEQGPTKLWLSSLPSDTPVRKLVHLAKLRWRIERDYQEMKNEVGLDHYEGRSWRGFHHHAALCATAHAFLALRRAIFPPVSNAMDPADGPTRPAARDPSQNRKLPSLPAPGQRSRPASGAVTHVIE
jgi:SRSO17 transposase